MTRSLRCIEYSNKMRKDLLRNWLVVSLIVVLVGALIFKWSILSLGLGTAGSAILVVTSIFTLSQMVQSEDLGVGWLVLDYVIKVGVVAGVVLLAKQIFGLDPRAAAAPIIVTIIITVVTQMSATQHRQRDSETPKSPGDL